MLCERRSGRDERSSIVAGLDACHELIAEIETGIGLDLIPPQSPARMRYVRCLEARREVAETLTHSNSVTELHRAHDLIVRVLHELRVTKQHLLPPL